MTNKEEETCNEKLVMLATLIATELVKNKTPTEIRQLKILVGHIYSTINALSMK